MATTVSKRIALYFWVFLILTTSGVYGILRVLWNSAWLEREQIFFWGLAVEFERELAPVLSESEKSDTVLEKLYQLTQLNPRVELFVLDGAGSPLYYLPQAEAEMYPVDMHAVREFLRYRESRSFPLLGTDPTCGLKDDCERRIFSVAATRIGSRKGFVYVLLNNEKYRSHSRAIEDAYLIYGGGTLIALFTFTMGCMGMLLFSQITSRLRKVAFAARQYQAGDLCSRVDDNYGDEISQLAADYNHMADTIAEQMQHLRSTDELRRELIANVSHDFKSPITSLKGNMQLLTQEYERLSDTQRIERIHSATKSVEALDRRVKEFFELSALESKQLVPNIAPFSILELIEEEVVPRYQSQASAAGVRLTFEHAEGCEAVVGDCYLIERVLSNLVDNAIRYAEENSDVFVRLSEQGGNIRCSVENGGPGIGREEINKVFERHFRGTNFKHSVGGSGLGLAIVREIVEAHGERIEVQSKNGKTVFSFALPKDEANS